MADNYLENKMEELRKGGGRLTKPLPRRKGEMHGRRALVTGSDAGAVCARVRELRRRGCRVAFCITGADNPDSDALGTATARETGARFYPGGAATPQFLADTLAHLTHDWKGLELLAVTDTPQPWMQTALDEAVAALPYPSDFGTRLIFSEYKYFRPIRLIKVKAQSRR